jgi:hypothetical protein
MAKVHFALRKVTGELQNVKQIFGIPDKTF